MFDLPILLAIAGTFFLAGAVKGVIGLGLPTVSLGLLATVLDLPSAMALLLVPSFATNLWQAASGGQARPILRRLWPFLLLATVTVWIGALALTRLDTHYLSALLGAVLAAYAALGLGGIRLSIPAAREAWAGPVFGAANGVLTGMTGSFVVPGVMYLQGIGLSREQLIQAMGMLFTLSTVALALALQGNGLITGELALASAGALVPALAGMLCGAALRRRLSEARFRQVFLVAILALGLYILARALL